MGLNSNYVIAPSLEMYFVNKDTGLPLTNGYVIFYKDNARSIPKPVYQLSGTPPNYSYTVLPNPSYLSAVGTFQDASGNDIIPYYLPYDSTLKNIELYYIEVYDSNGVLQFTREGWPNTVSDNITSDQDVTNFVPNGQFLAHLDIPAIALNNNIAGQVYQTVTTIAQGGWSFERQNNSATDLITFLEYPTTTSPSGNPRYAVQVKTTSTGVESFKDLRLKFPSVNSFASDTQPYNFYFEGASITAGDIIGCQIVLIKNFGTGGSPTTETPIATFTLNGSNNIKGFNTPILFHTNAGKSIPSNDDFIQIAIRFPNNTSFTAVLTDFAITVNDEPLTSFPTQTNAQQLAPSTAGWMPTPNPDGSDMYLPIKLGPNGYFADISEVGDIVNKTTDGDFVDSISTISNELLCDGKGYITSEYSPLGIPYSRLQSRLFNYGDTLNVPRFGTGPNFITAYLMNGANQKIILTNNKLGTQDDPDNGTSSPGFNFVEGYTGHATGFDYVGYVNGVGFITAKCKTVGVPLAALVDGGVGYATAMNPTDIRNTASTFYYWDLTSVTAASLANTGLQGKFFQFSNITTQYHMWFNLTDETNPAGAPAGAMGTQIKVHLDSDLNAIDVSKVISNVLSAHKIFYITFVAASTIPSSSWWSYSANSVNYYVWYNKDGTGIDPAPTGKTGIQVDIITSDTAIQVAAATKKAINSYSFATPDAQGLFLRGYDPDSEWDVNTNRFSNVNDLLTAPSIGDFELDEIYSHRHSYLGESVNSAAGGTPTLKLSAASETDFTGGLESRPVNMAVNFAIKY